MEKKSFLLYHENYEQSPSPRHPYFAMTANTFAKGSRSCRNAGMNSYISKPVNVKGIKTALTDLKGETQKPQK